MTARPLALVALACSLLGGCASTTPGLDFPKTPSSALDTPRETRLGAAIAEAGRAREGESAFKLLPRALDGFLARVQMADAAEKTLDLQYYIYRQDETSKLVSDALLRAADRGVRVRILLDDHGALMKSLVLALDAHPRIEVRLFNPFAYRGENALARYVELVVHAPRLKHRMHNKLMVADNSVGLVGGRNVGNEYFQANPEFEFGDYDLVAAGPVVRKLSQTFDEYWNSALAIPVAAFRKHEGDEKVLNDLRTALAIHRRNMDGTEYVKPLAAGEPIASVIAGRGVAWARAEVVSDPPDKFTKRRGKVTGWLEHEAVRDAAAATRRELLLISPYVVPGDEGMRFLRELRRREVKVLMVTNSLEATDVAVAHAGYARYRPTLLAEGIALYEARAAGRLRERKQYPFRAEELGPLLPAREGPRIRSRARPDRRDELRQAFARTQHGVRPPGSQPRAGAAGRKAVRVDCESREQLRGGARSQRQRRLRPAEAHVAHRARREARRARRGAGAQPVAAHDGGFPARAADRRAGRRGRLPLSLERSA